MGLTLSRDGDELVVAWRFGGGLHTALTPQDIGDREAASGKNQDLQLDRAVLKKRKPIELVGTAPNAETIRGFAELIKSDGSVSNLVQAGERVYRWYGGAPSYIAKAAEFDGSNDYLLRGGGLTGAVDSKLLTLFFWMYYDVTPGVGYRFFTSTGSLIGVTVNSSNEFNFLFTKVGGATAVSATASQTVTAATWTAVMISIDLTQNRVQIYFGDTDASPTSPTISVADIDFTHADWGIAANVDGTLKLDGRMSEFWFLIGTSIDFSLEDNRRKFFGESGGVVPLGKRGERPTDEIPIIYLKGNSTNFQVNHGTGGPFAVTGALSEPATVPPDGSSFVRVGRVPLGARLRGGRHSTSLLDEKVVITDLNLLADIKTWDGVNTFEDLAHNLGGTLRAKYAVVEDERLLLANLRTTSSTAHVLLASKRSSITTFTEADRPSSSLGPGDAYFLLIPDFKPINALLSAFGRLIMSTEKGRIWQLIGSDATDFALTNLFADSNAEGDEAVVSIGNDVIFGRHGKIDSLVGVEAFGDVATDDVSRWISEEIKDVTKWEIIYNPRLQRAYCWPLIDKNGRGGRLYVFAKALFDPIRRRTVQVQAGGDTVSPWMRWETTFGEEDFFPTAAALVRNPESGLDHVYFGDDAGRIFQLEGEGSQDAGSVSFTMECVSPLVILPGDLDAYDLEGYVLYEERASTNLVLNIQYQGTRLHDGPDITIPIPDPATFSVFGGNVYFGGVFYFGVPFDKRLNRFPFKSAGAGSAFQIKASVATDENLAVHEIGLRIKDAAR
jgi:hypothetical protein